jgi:hypothetical protein
MLKRTVALSVFGLVLLLVCQSAKAAVVEVDVTVKSVDAKARGITVTYETKLGQKSIDLDVSRKAEITVNGKPGKLDAVKPGQKAKVAFEKELQVVTKIDATGKGTEPGREVYRLLLSVSEFGDCVLKVEQTTTPISSEAKVDGKPQKLKCLPNAEVLRFSDGRFSIIHSFDHSDELPSIFSSAHNAELDRSLGAVTFKPRKNDNSVIAYWSFVQLPAVICYDRLPMEGNSGIALHFNIGSPAVGSLGINFGRENDGRTFSGVYWDDAKDGKATKHTQLLDRTPFDIEEGTKRKFRLPVPNVRIEENCHVWLEGWSDEGTKSDMVHLMVQGRLHPILGIGFADGMGMVFAKSVNHGSVAEKAGFKAGDVVLSINGQIPKSMTDAMNLCRKPFLGDEIKFKIRRGDEERELKMVVE